MRVVERDAFLPSQIMVFAVVGLLGKMSKMSSLPMCSSNGPGMPHDPEPVSCSTGTGTLFSSPGAWECRSSSSVPTPSAV